MRTAFRFLVVSATMLSMVVFAFTEGIEELTSNEEAADGKAPRGSSDTLQQRLNSSGNPTTTIPFVPKTAHSIPQQYEPPKGFSITARVYTDPEDKLAHFDNDGSVVFPYGECGMTGSSTVPIPLQHATVRHLLGGSIPNLYSGEEFGPHPQLVIALTYLEVVLNSGQIQIFKPGDVILLEDVVSGGHKLKGHDQQDMTVMILTLPNHYHHVGKDKSSLHDIFVNMKKGSCPAGWQDFTSGKELTLAEKVGNALKRFQPRSMRRYLLTMVGLSISTLVGDFVGKVAPLWLTVVFGGGCFVAGGTYSFVKLGDKALNEIETWQERQQLRLEEGEVREVKLTKDDEEELGIEIPQMQ